MKINSEEIEKLFEDSKISLKDEYESFIAKIKEDLTKSRQQALYKIKRIVDVKIPSLEISTKNKSSDLTYGFADTNSSLDQATKLIRDILPGICKAAEFENAIFSLAKELEKTQKLINALEYVIIPQYQNALTFIKSTLEEREREEFVRLKKVKAVIERKASK